ncbi:MAG: hypothetical protein L0Y71_03810 [Gemmataceae bacterium]|nr:hypothetical protein [Gemmataceae bacterium]
MAGGSWLVIEEFLERGDPAFVDELRACEDAPRLAAFAATWHADRRPAARRFLLEYLRRPLNAFHHEGLVKRLFKIAEKAGDDEALAHFLVLFDRSIRRRHRKTSRFVNETFSSQAAALAQQRQWEADGAENTGISGWGGNFYAWARWPVERLVVPRDTAMPRDLTASKYRNPRTGSMITWLELMRISLGRSPGSPRDLPEKVRTQIEKLRLFSVHTRHYLRRRVWRYFRNLSETAPDRYVPAVMIALKLYDDADVADGIALLDNWGLIHILFHHSAALWPRSHGWTLRPGQPLSALAPAPAFPDLWRQTPSAILELLRTARCRPVRQWALFFMRQDPTLLDRAGLDVLLELLQSDEPEVVALAARALENRPGLDGISVERWLRLLDTAPPTALDAVCGLVRARLQPASLTLDQLVGLACRRPLPVARLGFGWLQERVLGAGDWATLARLTDAEAESLRPEMVRWARTVLSRAADFSPQWALDYLDSRHDDVRGEGWAWLADDPRVHDDVQIWQRLFESPYDDVRLKLVGYLENRYARRGLAMPANVPLDPEHVRLLWATVLLNIQRGSRTKPLVVGQLVRRLTERPDDAAALLPILKVALRSVRGPEWRVGLAGVVTLFERQPQLDKVIQESFPELQMVS